MPTPRGEVAEVRLALSNEDLNINGMSRRVHIFFNSVATSIVISSDSIAHGPANRANLRLPPIVIVSVMLMLFFISLCVATIFL